MNRILKNDLNKGSLSLYNECLLDFNFLDKSVIVYSYRDNYNHLEIAFSVRELEEIPLNSTERFSELVLKIEDHYIIKHNNVVISSDIKTLGGTL